MDRRTFLFLTLTGFPLSLSLTHTRTHTPRWCHELDLFSQRDACRPEAQGRSKRGRCVTPTNPKHYTQHKNKGPSCTTLVATRTVEKDLSGIHTEVMCTLEGSFAHEKTTLGNSFLRSPYMIRRSMILCTVVCGPYIFRFHEKRVCAVFEWLRCAKNEYADLGFSRKQVRAQLAGMDFQFSARTIKARVQFSTLHHSGTQIWSRKIASSIWGGVLSGVVPVFPRGRREGLKSQRY